MPANTDEFAIGFVPLAINPVDPRLRGKDVIDNHLRLVFEDGDDEKYARYGQSKPLYAAKTTRLCKDLLRPEAQNEETAKTMNQFLKVESSQFWAELRSIWGSGYEMLCPWDEGEEKATHYRFFLSACANEQVYGWDKWE